MAELNETDQITTVIDTRVKPSVGRKMRAVISDAFAAIRSSAVNTALATVTFETLMGEQIARNGESAKSNSSQYNPYSYDPSKPAPEGVEPGWPANFAGVADTGRPTKIERILALKNEIDGVSEQVKKISPTVVAESEELLGDDWLTDAEIQEQEGQLASSGWEDEDEQQQLAAAGWNDDNA